ncbi:periplasmic heavy metal sensor [Luteolibacter soli]|uniref:Periplasmic heavy metal sensor n=1 Tax=Luteolibacter soli TaxID=3135280 RepID=A0ABU9AUR5_9BACT
MTPGAQRLALSLATVVLAGLTAWLVTLSAQRDAAIRARAAKDFHHWMHEQLALTDAQHEALNPIEQAYQQEKEQLQKEITAAGGELAAAVRAGKSGSPEIEAALTRLNSAQARLQHATLAHFFAMKEHLDPAQSEKLLQWTHDSILAQ